MNINVAFKYLHVEQVFLGAQAFRWNITHDRGPRLRGQMLLTQSGW